MRFTESQSQWVNMIIINHLLAAKTMSMHSPVMHENIYHCCIMLNDPSMAIYTKKSVLKTNDFLL